MPTDSTEKPHPRTAQTLVGAGVLLLGAALVWGAKDISSDAGYGGVGPNFLPLLSALALMVCGSVLIWEARSGGFRAMGDDATDAVAPYLSGFIWVSTGLLLNGVLISRLGFVLSCTLCYLLAVQGLRRAAGQAKVNAPRTWLTDALTGLAIAAPVYWLFTKFLAINLPGLTTTGWI